MNESLALVIKEAVAGRNYYTHENYADENAVGQLAQALRALGCTVDVDGDDFIKIRSMP
jgi:UDP-N-acetylglucosamine enolpyruvyl transferase